MDAEEIDDIEDFSATFEKLNRAAARYYDLRCLIALAIRDQKPLPDEIRDFFLTQQKLIDDELGYTEDERKERLRRMYRNATGDYD